MTINSASSRTTIEARLRSKATSTIAATLLGLLCLLPVIGQADDSNLPDIGSSQSSLLTLAHQQKVAEQVLRNLRQQGLLINDPELSEYIQNLGQRLSSHLESTEPYHFYLLKDSQINAFALPAGYIVINAGLFLTTRSEDELASVLGHEIAHVSQKHYLRGGEMAQKQSVMLAAALIAAIAVGRQDSNAGSALLMGGMANNMANSLVFSREREQEADRLGIDLLTKSGFNAEAMPSFFERMQEANRYNNDNLPEFLRTHPVTLNRISEAKDRAARLPDNHHKSSQDYALMWHKLAALLGVTPGTHYVPPPNLHPGTDAYSQALTNLSQDHYAKALQAIKQAIKAAPDQPLMQTAEARIYEAMNKPRLAVTIYHHLYEVFPSQASITLGYGQALMNAKQARTAKSVLRQTLNDGSEKLPQLYRLLADSEQQLGNLAASHRYLSEYYFEIGNPVAAKTQLEIALKQKDLSFYEKEEYQARLNQMLEHLQLLSQMPDS